MLDKKYDYNDSKICENCKGVYYRDIRQAKDVFKRRKYCGYKCTFEAQRKNKHWRNTYSGNSETL